MSEDISDENQSREDAIRREYLRCRSDFKACARKIRMLLDELLRADGQRVHSVAARVKNEDSLIRKVRDGSGKYQSLDEVTDIVGVRVITYFADEVDDVAQLIEQEFEVDFENSLDKADALDPDRFGYLSMHYLVTLGPQRADLTEYAPFADMPIELQVRSILQHAWAEIEHDLGYKSPGEIPRAVRRRFSRLAGLLELADDEFLSIRNTLRDYTASLQPMIESSPDAVFLDRESMDAFIRHNEVPVKLAATLSKRGGMSIDWDRLDDDARTFSESLKEFGLETIQDVEGELRRHAELIVTFGVPWMRRAFNDGTEESGGMTISPGVAVFYLQYILAGRRGIEGLVEYIMRANIHSEDGPSALALDVWESLDRARALIGQTENEARAD